MSKIGRNDHCPCGSGKKFKFCCLQTDKQPKRTENTSAFDGFCRENGFVDLLNLLIATQLTPENHGKNLRVDQLVVKVLSNKNTSSGVNLKSLKNIVSQHYAYNHLEDLPTGLFMEITDFIGGNFPIFQGISTDSNDVFKSLGYSVFSNDRITESTFEHEVYSGIRLILELGKIYASKTRLEGVIIGGENKRKIVVPDKITDYGIPKSLYTDLCSRHRLQKDIINEFMPSDNHNESISGNQHHFVLHLRPIVEFGGNYFYTLPSNQSETLVEFILRTAKRHGKTEELLLKYNRSVWHDLKQGYQKMYWMPAPVDLPEPCNMALFQATYLFDSTYMALTIHIGVADIEPIEFENQVQLAPNINEHIANAIKSIRGQVSALCTKILVVLTFDSIGRETHLSVKSHIQDDHVLVFPAHPFLDLIDSEKWEMLDLWKFVKVAAKKRDLMLPQMDTIDRYWLYKQYRQSFYISPETRFSAVYVMPGEGYDIIKEAKKRDNQHGVIAVMDDIDQCIPVSLCRDFAPIYKPRYPNPYFMQVLESYDCPIWVASGLEETDSKRLSSFSREFGESVLIWLYRMKPSLETYFQGLSRPITIEIDVDKGFEEAPKRTEINALRGQFKIELSGNENLLKVFVPISFFKSISSGNNEGERDFVKRLVKALVPLFGSPITDDEIQDIVDKNIPFGPHKLMIINDSGLNILSATNNLSPPLLLSEAEIGLVEDQLFEKVKSRNLEKLLYSQTSENKLAFLNKTVDILVEWLEDEVKHFEGYTLITALLQFNEANIFLKEYRQVMIPANLLSIAGLKKPFENLEHDIQRFTNSAVALRCLLECVAAKAPNGKKLITRDDADRLLSIMHEIIRLGFVSDSIHLGIDNPKVTLLESGRIGIEDTFFEKALLPFRSDNLNEEIDEYLKSFESRMNTPIVEDSDLKPKTSKSLEELNLAFLSDFGFSFEEMCLFCHSCTNLCLERETSVLSISKSSFLKELNRLTSLSTTKIEALLNKFSIRNRPKYLVAPDGFSNLEVFPWKYNREFSTNRRFIMRNVESEENDTLSWGMRHSTMTLQHLTYLLYEGKLTNTGQKLTKLQGKFRETKGKRFTQQVRDFLTLDKRLKVIPYEVTVKPIGHLTASENLGDIDILVFIPDTSQVFSIECKCTNQAKNVHEMKKEMDNYLGRGKKTGLMDKHVKRHKWLLENEPQVARFCGASKNVKIFSVVLTSELLPTRYIGKTQLPMPLYSFYQLKQSGVELFEK